MFILHHLYNSYRMLFLLYGMFNYNVKWGNFVSYQIYILNIFQRKRCKVKIKSFNELIQAAPAKFVTSKYYCIAGHRQQEK